MKNIIILTTTFSTKEDAKQMAASLIEKKIIGCAQVSGPIDSMYHWQGVVESEQEFKLSVKTLPSHAEKTMDAIKEMHPYDVPEIIGEKTDFCSTEYYEWLKNEVAGE